jgi:hypothetical protein
MDLVRRTNKLLEGAGTIFFEHGRRLKGIEAGCGIEHLHVHAVPISRPIDIINLAKPTIEFQSLETLGQLADHPASRRSYVYYQDAEGHKYVAHADLLPSQFMRQTLAKAMGTTDWNWKSANFEERLIRTYKTYKYTLRDLETQDCRLSNTAYCEYT